MAACWSKDHGDPLGRQLLEPKHHSPYTHSQIRITSHDSKDCSTYLVPGRLKRLERKRLLPQCELTFSVYCNVRLSSNIHRVTDEKHTHRRRGFLHL